MKVIKILKDHFDGEMWNKGDIKEVSNKAAEDKIDQGFAEEVSQKAKDRKKKK